MGGQDEGRLSGFVANGQGVLRRNPLSSFPAGPPTPPLLVAGDVDERFRVAADVVIDGLLALSGRTDCGG